jgi:hypothetical protein
MKRQRQPKTKNPPRPPSKPPRWTEGRVTPQPITNALELPMGEFRAWGGK